MRKMPVPDSELLAQPVTGVPEPEWGGSAAGRFTAEQTDRLPAEKRRSWAAEAVWAVLLFLLLREWIVPIVDLSEAADAAPLIPITLAVGAFVFLDFLRVPVIVGVPVKLSAAVATVGWLFNDRSLPGKHWLAEYIRLTFTDMDNLLASHWDALSAENRTLLFLIGWAMLAGVIQTILVHRKRGLWLVGATLVYLAALAIAAGADTTAGIVRTAVLGFLLMAVLQLSLLRERYGSGLLHTVRIEAAETRIRSPLFIASAVNARGSRPMLWTVLSVLFIAAFFAIGYAGAYRQERSVEPVDAESFYRLAQSFGWKIGGDSADGQMYVPEKARTGYGDDDSQLGGSLTEDTGLVFTAKTEIPAYWRGESKSYYDGKGWTEPPDASRSLPFLETAGPAGGLNRTITQEISWSGDAASKLLFAGGPIRKLEALISQQGKSLVEQPLDVNPVAGKYAAPLADGDRLSYARMQVTVPEHSAERLRKAGADVPAGIRERYLQLPSGMPKRVAELAQNAVKGADNPYDKAKALELFLKEKYSYRLQGGAPAGKNEDFVDAFLFRQGSGYCDYFSTAMTVMLRTAGIPARWVKGFAPGQIQESPKGGASLYTVAVRNKDAHSWVEAYFPGEGWVPFDPTPGFSGFENPSANVTLTDESASSPVEQPKANPSFVLTKWKELPRYMNRTVRMVSDAPVQIGRMGRKFGIAAALALAVVVLGGLLWRRRHVLGFRYMLRRYRHPGGNPGHLIRLLDKLWLRIFQYYGPKDPNETIREYVGKLKPPSPEAKEALFELAKMYEDARYGAGRFQWVPKRRIRQVWSHVFRKKSDALYIQPME